MKKILIALLAFSTLWSCQTDEEYARLNVDPKNPSEIDAKYLFSNAIVSLSDALQSINVNDNVIRFSCQYLTATTYLDEPNYNLTSRKIAEDFWDEIYTDVLKDLVDAKKSLTANTDLFDYEKKPRIAQVEIMTVYAWQVLVDTFGDIPYTGAFNPEESIQPSYDDDAAIYEDLINRLMKALPELSAGQGYTTTDVIYGGDMNKWSKFGHSLLLRLGMRVSDVNPTLSRKAVNMAIGNVLLSNKDNAVVNYLGTFPNTNPLWVDLVRSGRSDYVVANTIVDYMVPLNDPRVSVYFDNNVTPYKGGPYGETSKYENHTHLGPTFRDPLLPGIFMDRAEVEFLLAQAAKIGTYNTAISAQKHYENAVTASIKYWTGDASLAAAYLSGAAAYDGTNAQLATQFWIAMFNNPFQGWCVYRKFDAPTMNIAKRDQVKVPLRYTYPIRELNLNEASYTAAAAAIGGDEQQTPIFWDVN